MSLAILADVDFQSAASRHRLASIDHEIEQDLFDLSGKRVLVTGASRGIGLAIAKGLGQQGAQVVITSRKLDGINAAADQLRTEGCKVQPLVCHQGEAASIRALFEQIDQTGGP